MLVDQTICKNNIDIIENTEVKEINTDQIDCLYLNLSNGGKLQCDMIYCANGHVPSINFLKDLNIELNENGYIKTNLSLSSSETSIKNMFACGSVVETKYLTTCATLGLGAIAATDILNRLDELNN